jgi:hypothetical protein
MGADDDVVELARLLPARFFVAFSHFGVGALGNIELRAGGVVAAKDREGHSFQTFSDDGLGILSFDAIAHGFDIFDLEAEMIQPRGNAGTARQDGESDQSVANVTAIGLGDRRGDLLHAQDFLVKTDRALGILRINGRVFDACEHGTLLGPMILWLKQDYPKPRRHVKVMRGK